MASTDDVTIRRLDGTFIEPIFEMHNRVYEEIGRDDLYRARDHDHIADLFGDDGLCFGAFLGGRLVGYSSVRFPAAEGDGLSAQLGFAPAQRRYIAECDASCVLPDARGRRLQERLIEVRARGGLARGRVLGMAIVGPKNVYSLRNFLQYGMRGVALHRIASGEDRMVMARDHSELPNRLENNRERRPVGISCDEIQAILRSGGQLDRVIQDGDEWHYEFVWFAHIADERSWVDAFNTKDFFGL